jgi:putative ABC transport system substrate-binding protein
MRPDRDRLSVQSKEIAMRWREFIAGLSVAAVAWPLAARGQQPALPVIGFVNAGSAEPSAGYVAAFRKGLGETGYVEGQNVTVEYHWLAACRTRG